ncbi:MAG: transcriptional regulator [Chloroflexi bacterium]|nr:MAG: transcriptional regulator [Chloroflexota bacterium]
MAEQRANPAPLGLAGFGLTTTVLTLHVAGILPAEGESVVFALAFAFGGAAQLIAGVLEYVNGNTFGTTAFTSYGAFWWWVALNTWTAGAGWITAPAASGAAVTLLFWGVFTFYLWIATWTHPRAVWLLFLLLWVVFLLLALGDFGLSFLTPIGGWVGVVLGLLALYISAALVINDSFKRDVLPLGAPLAKPATPSEAPAPAS